MAFHTTRFMQTKFVPRTERIACKDLADFFDSGSSCEFIVRGLTSNEFAKSNDAKVRRDQLEGVLSAISSKADIKESIEKVLGYTDDVEGEVAKRLTMLEYGSVEPMLPLEVCVKLSEHFPIEFYQLTNAIIKLTGQGSRQEKSRGSGAIAA